jgi:hypothetical protein
MAYSFSADYPTTSPGRGGISVAHDASRGFSHEWESRALEEGGIISTEVIIKLAI